MNPAVWMILIAAAITFALRAVPFVLFGRGKAMPPLMEKLARRLPAAIMAVLVVYSLKSVAAQSLRESLPLLLASAATVAVHLWRKNAPLSIALGTLLYMILIRIP